VRERWLGATGRRVPEIATELDLPDDVLWAESASDDEIRAAHAEGRPVVAHADDAEGVKRWLGRPEIASVLVPPGRADLLDLDLRRLTYG
jgi:hypothetical protein